MISITLADIVKRLENVYFTSTYYSICSLPIEKDIFKLRLGNIIIREFYLIVVDTSYVPLLLKMVHWDVGG